MFWHAYRHCQLACLLALVFAAALGCTTSPASPPHIVKSSASLSYTVTQTPNILALPQAGGIVGTLSFPGTKPPFNGVTDITTLVLTTSTTPPSPFPSFSVLPVNVLFYERILPDLTIALKGPLLLSFQSPSGLSSSAQVYVEVFHLAFGWAGSVSAGPAYASNGLVNLNVPFPTILDNNLTTIHGRGSLGPEEDGLLLVVYAGSTNAPARTIVMNPPSVSLSNSAPTSNVVASEVDYFGSFTSNTSCNPGSTSAFVSPIFSVSGQFAIGGVGNGTCTTTFSDNLGDVQTLNVSVAVSPPPGP